MQIVAVNFTSAWGSNVQARDSCLENVILLVIEEVLVGCLVGVPSSVVHSIAPIHLFVLQKELVYGSTRLQSPYHKWQMVMRPSINPLYTVSKGITWLVFQCAQDPQVPHVRESMSNESVVVLRDSGLCNSLIEELGEPWSIEFICCQ